MKFSSGILFGLAILCSLRCRKSGYILVNLDGTENDHDLVKYGGQNSAIRGQFRAPPRPKSPGFKPKYPFKVSIPYHPIIKMQHPNGLKLVMPSKGNGGTFAGAHGVKAPPPPFNVNSEQFKTLKRPGRGPKLNINPPNRFFPPKKPIHPNGAQVVEFK